MNKWLVLLIYINSYLVVFVNFVSEIDQSGPLFFPRLSNNLTICLCEESNWFPSYWVSLLNIQGYGWIESHNSDCSLKFGCPFLLRSPCSCEPTTPNHDVHWLHSNLVAQAKYSDCLFYIPSSSNQFTSWFSIWCLDSAIGSFSAHSLTGWPLKNSCYDLNQLLWYCISVSDFNSDHENNNQQTNKMCEYIWMGFAVSSPFQKQSTGTFICAEELWAWQVFGIVATCLPCLRWSRFTTMLKDRAQTHGAREARRVSSFCRKIK